MTSIFDRAYQLIEAQLSLDNTYPIIAMKLKEFLYEEKYDGDFFNTLCAQTGEKSSKEFALLIGFLLQYGVEVAPDQKKAFEWYKKAASNGLPSAHLLLGNDYVLSDKKSAFEHLEAAANLGSGYGQCRLGSWYFFGEGDNRADYRKAFYYYSKSQDKDVSGQQGMATCYHNGLGIETDIHKAIRYYIKAHKKESPCAYNKLREIMDSYDTA